MITNRRTRMELAFLYYLFIIASICAMLGSFVPVMELAEHFAVQYVIAAAVLGIATWYMGDKIKAAVCLALLLFHGVTIASVATVTQANATPAAQSFTILQFNALYKNNDPEAVAALDTLTDVDLIVMQEYPAKPVFDSAFNEHWPHQYRPTYSDVFFRGVAVFSKHPFEIEALHQAGLDDYAGLWRLTFTEQGLVVYGVHSPTPIPSNAAEQRDKQQRWLMKLMSKESLPSVAVGDFNQTPYVRNFRTALKENHIHLAPFIDSLLPTWPRIFYLPIFQVPIDLALANERAVILSRERISIVGSDHIAVKNVVAAKVVP